MIVLLHCGSSFRGGRMLGVRRPPVCPAFRGGCSVGPGWAVVRSGGVGSAWQVDRGVEGGPGWFPGPLLGVRRVSRRAERASREGMLIR